MILSLIVVDVIDIGARTDRDQHLLSVFGERDITRPVPATAQSAAAGQVGDFLRCAGGLEVAALIRKTNHSVGIADIYPLRIRAQRIERDAEWLVQSLCKHLDGLGFSVATHAAEDLDVSRFALRQKNVAVGSSANFARIAETFSIEVHFEA